ncbi:MAG: hypothetical protein OES84_04475 [Kiritimatiellaceae bacterium]|nr:hypothetical protein [Kiritimatiellaceae bacterium]
MGLLLLGSASTQAQANPKPNFIIIFTDDQGYIRKTSKKLELYNFAEEISEKRNLALQMPEKVARLEDRMRELDLKLSKEIRPHGKLYP